MGASRQARTDRAFERARAQQDDVRAAGSSAASVARRIVGTPTTDAAPSSSTAPSHASAPSTSSASTALPRFPAVASRLSPSVIASFAALALALLCPNDASADWGDGIGVGHGRMHLGLELDGRYDSQVGHGFFSGRQSPDPADGIARLRGVVKVDAPGPSYKLDLDAKLDWNQYLGLVTGTRPLSYFGADVRGGVVFQGEGPVKFELGGSVVHSDRSATPVFGIGVLSMHNAAHARLRAKPGGGALELMGGYEFFADIFSPQLHPTPGKTSGICEELFECNPDLAAAFNALTHRLGAEVRWMLFPKTGLTLSGDVAFRHYMFGTDYSVPNVGAMPVRAQLGFGTFFTPRLSFHVKGGWVGLFLSEDLETVHTWSGSTELAFRVTQTLRLRGGYRRSVEPVGGGSVWYGMHRGFVDFKAQFSRLVLTAMVSADLVQFGYIARHDVNLGATLRAEYNLAQWIRLTAGAAAHRRISEGDRERTGAFSFNREEISVGVATLF